MEDRSSPRRTGGVRTGGRSARVVEAVHVATLEELGRVGYAALRIEDVASRSGVNKTTIYRRWPTKIDLVADAVRSQSVVVEVDDTGDLRADLVSMLKQGVEHFLTKERVGLMRVFYAERANPEVDALARELRDEHRSPRIARVARAIEQGHLPRDTDAVLVVDVLLGTVYGRIARAGEPVSDRYIEALVDLVLDGALHGGGIPRDRA